ncbi:MAG TPA: CocE/NonD family hydrolase [Solirubrobacterales bacterium]|jgi:hypothetical protein
MGEDKSTEVSIEFDVPARMRDGVTLRANVYRPETGGPWPTLLTRLPYGKDLPPVVSILDPVQTARRGFMVVIQDTRGRFASDGEWKPFAYEREDGYDSVEWAAGLPGSNGRVGMYGESYLGSTQWMAAIERPPSLAAIAPALTWSNPLDGLFARGGALELGLMVPWSIETGFDYVTRMDISAAERGRRIEAMVEDYDALSKGLYLETFAGDDPVRQRHGVPPMPSLAAVESPEIAASCVVEGAQERVEVPTLHIGGWYDIFLGGTLVNYTAMAAAGRETRLVVGPWTHVRWSDPFGDLTLGLRASRFGFPAHPEGDTADVQRAFFRRHLSSSTPTVESDAPVRIFVMGRNRWQDEPSWPPPDVVEQRWFLQTGGGLAPEQPKGDGESSFVYDSDDPVPTVGGNTVMPPGFPSGPFDQSSIERREDVLVFTSDPLSVEMEVTGEVILVLHADSSAPSTDWVGRLCDVHPNGTSINLCDGILRVDGAGASGRYVLDLWATSNVFLPGHRLRVHITGGSFPRWDRNPGGTSRRVHHGGDRSSYVSLPVRRLPD